LSQPGIIHSFSTFHVENYVGFAEKVISDNPQNGLKINSGLFESLG